MWDVVRFTEYHQYEIVSVENVVEAKTRWGLFDVWLQAMHNLGYRHECLYINSMHCHPTPQSRDRMYVVFWKKGNPKPNLNFTPEAYCSKCGKIVQSYQWWKNPNKKYGKYGKNGQYLFRCPGCTEVVEPFYHAAFNIIDWSIPGKPVLGREKPLSKNTIRRIEYGLEKYGDLALVIGSRYHAGLECRVKSSIDPLTTQPTQSSHAFLFPYMIKTDNSKVKDAVTVRSAADPFRTVTTSDPHGIVIPAASIIVNNGQSKAKPATDALPSMTTEMKHGIINPESLRCFISYYNGCNGTGAQASHISESTDVVSTIDRMALVQHKRPTLEECTYRTIRPHEVHKAMAFGDDYVVLGNGKEKVKQLGNAVTPPVMKWIVSRCIESLS